MTLANASAMRRALENAGVELIDENGRGTRRSSKATSTGSINALKHAGYAATGMVRTENLIRR
jgi:tRNA U34 5-methylaminomethyl-2-thiouridine-forming methyltransferase MnmC